ncbi:hypothetical protein SBI_01243 [Streptomyces bingchenggensis BCW-1]|uniref:Uncharacterized protein n=1 Tax=Streptomyces bingchenggensis (strain BCW-1) TaxID=749414 RepID=D7CA36_STRBB|nr:MULTISPECIES: hypothetical protein [Streptomyces]ADI04364.1 hypothetical protein SBI_01243 [Streptomyces bingchenggensis BCW-1]
MIHRRRARRISGHSPSAIRSNGPACGVFATRLGGELAEPDQAFNALIRGVHAVAERANALHVVEAAQSMIANAAKQLRDKSSPDRARVVFIVSHFLDRPYVECLDLVIAHALTAPTLPDEIDAMWVFFAPSHLVVWSAVEQRWTQLLLGSFKEEGTAPEVDFGMEPLQHYEGLFLEPAGIDGPSPFYYGLGTGELASAVDAE